MNLSVLGLDPHRRHKTPSSKWRGIFIVHHHASTVKGACLLFIDSWYKNQNLDRCDRCEFKRSIYIAYYQPVDTLFMRSQCRHYPPIISSNSYPTFRSPFNIHSCQNGHDEVKDLRYLPRLILVLAVDIIDES